MITFSHSTANEISYIVEGLVENLIIEAQKFTDQAERDALREVLEFYTKETNWWSFRGTDGSLMTGDEPVLADEGSIAQAALPPETQEEK